MARIPKTVFISYRRTNQAHAVKIYHLLQEAGYDPFLDIKDLGAGAWRVIIQREIQRRAHFVVLLTPSAVERFAEPNDVMRFEIETALASKRNLVPLMFEGFTYADPRIRTYLTGKLAILSEYNAFPINWRRLKKDIQEVINRFMSVHPDDVVHPEAVLVGGFTPDNTIWQEITASQPMLGEMRDGASIAETARTPAKKSGVLMMLLTAPVALVHGAYQAVRHFIHPPKPAPIGLDKTIRSEHAPTSTYQPAPAPPPQSMPGGVASDMDEAQLLLMMRQALANLPPVSDDQLAHEEAEEWRG